MRPVASPGAHDRPDAPEPVAYESTAGRWVLAVAVLGSGLAFLDGTVVNVALPEIGRDLDASTSSLQWILNGYLLTLASLILLGGSLGDRYGRRRIFVLGTVVFTVASLLCAIAPNAELLVVARLLQGVGGALLTPGQPGDDRVELPPRRPRPRDRRLVGAGRGRDRARTAARRLSGRRGVVASDLPDQPADRHVRRGDGRAATCPRPAIRPPAARSTCGARCSRRSALRGRPTP